MTPRIGCILPTDTSFSRLVEISRICERLGYDSIWAFDHLAPYWLKPPASLECWTTLASLAANTQNIKLGSLVTNVNLRHASLLAKITSSLDNISHGRVILGIGAGDTLSKRELTSFGYQYETLDERVTLLGETIQILKGLWKSDDFSFVGAHFRISHARLEPKPTQSHLPIWIGGKHHRLMDLVAELADGWNYWKIDREELIKTTSYLRNRCARTQRSFDKIVKSWSGTIPRNYSTNQLVDYLKERSDAKSGYFIGYFGKYTGQEALEEFADVTRKL
jgi:alkanesulfonate monooxygenase SsuD/methylene tetrahydromethanopterin reductase-like flavin-dependent oxidoreductase (luciferase family)